MPSSSLPQEETFCFVFNFDQFMLIQSNWTLYPNKFSNGVPIYSFVLVIIILLGKVASTSLLSLCANSWLRVSSYFPNGCPSI